MSNSDPYTPPKVFKDKELADKVCDIMQKLVDPVTGATEMLKLFRWKLYRISDDGDYVSAEGGAKLTEDDFSSYTAILNGVISLVERLCWNLTEPQWWKDLKDWEAYYAQERFSEKDSSKLIVDKNGITKIE
ncbi:MAG: hypothetical protein IIB39_04790 [Candidatus Marinimicrobia bacterium]|nr:hypothetical protein [Candidatus Neomarinimicrobiota bacterium]